MGLKNTQTNKEGETDIKYHTCKIIFSRDFFNFKTLKLALNRDIFHSNQNKEDETNNNFIVISSYSLNILKSSRIKKVQHKIRCHPLIMNF